MSRLRLFSFLALLMPIFIAAQNDGDLDLSFNGTGVATFAPGPLHDNVNRVVVQTDGKIIFAGQSNTNNISFSSLDLTVGRANPDGSIDMTFGEDGYYQLTNDGGSDFTFDMELLSDGKILIGAGYSITDANTAFLIIRLNADGTPDNTFSNDGYTVIEIGAGEDYCRKIFPQPDGSVICAGWSSLPGFTYNRITLCKLTAAGTLDLSFGNNNGIAIINQVTNHTYNVFDGVQEGDDLFICGSVYDENLFADLPVIFKFNTSGVADNSFGINGFLQSETKGYYFGMINKGDGLLISGDDESANDYDAIIAAYNYDGSIQTDFGNNGVSSFNLGALDGWNTLYAMPDGRLLAVGVTGNSFFDRSLMAARFHADGSPDTAFGDNGAITYSDGTFFDVGNDITQQPDGKIIIGGVTASTNNDMLLLRLYNGPVVILPLTATAGNTTPASCFGSSDGTATLSVSGGVSPYSFYLDNGLTDVGNPIANLSAGGHSVAVIDAQGEVFIVDFIIGQPTALVLDIDVSGADIQATATGGTPPYLYSNGGPLQATGVFTDLPPGAYNIVVVDANGCNAAMVAEILVKTDNTTATEFKIQPTVSEGLFTITGANIREEIMVFNVSGTCVLTLPCIENEMTLDLSFCPSGPYLVSSGRQAVQVMVVR